MMFQGTKGSQEKEKLQTQDNAREKEGKLVVFGTRKNVIRLAAAKN